MKLVTEPWDTLERFHDVGGVLEFYRFDDVVDLDGMPEAIGMALKSWAAGEVELVERNLATPSALRDYAPEEISVIISRIRAGWLVEPDLVRLIQLGCRLITADEFLGEGYNRVADELVYPGDVTTSDGRILHAPVFSQLDGIEIKAAGSGWPEPGTRPGFARAFAEPPYSLDCSYSERQALFDDLRSDLFPQGQPFQIFDWSNPDLPDVHPYFSGGAEWWGVHLYCVHQSDLDRLIVILGSATD